MTAPWLKTLNEIEGNALPLVGGKAFNLATLRRHGLPVTNGLVVTCAFFEAHLKYHQFTPIWAGSPDVAVTEGALHWLADALKISPIAPELMDALNAGLTETFPDVESFAVRSSAIDEDTSQHTFSGIHVSELGVPREMVPVSLSRCWASALSKPALEYRRQHGIPIQSIRLAVLIQPFIQPAVAGVAFTINPLLGTRDEMVIEATLGHRCSVAGGEITPARYHLSKHSPDYPLLSWTPGDTPQLTSATGTRHDTSLVSNGRGPLSASQLQKLAQYLEHIEALMGAPQDVEWAITGQNLEEGDEIFFFQSRPITGLPRDAVPFNVEWSRADYREFLPDTPSPLCASLLERTQAKALSFFERLGFSVDEVGPYLKNIYGRPYLNLTLARRLLAQSGLSPDGMLWVIGHTELSGTAGRTQTIDWHQMWKSRRPIIKLLLNGLRVRAKLSHFERLTDKVRNSLSTIDWTEVSPASLLARFRFRTQLGSQWAEADFILSAAAVAAYSVLAQTLGPLTSDVEQLARETISTSTTTGSAQQGRMLLDLARIAQADDQVRNYLSDPAPNFADHRQALAGTPFLAAFDDFMAQHGRSATFEADLGCPRYDEDPLSLLTAVAHMTKVEALPDQRGTDDVEHDLGRTPRGYEDKDIQLRVSLQPTKGLERLLPWRYWSAKLIIKRLRRLATMRAQLRTLYGQSMGDCRAWDLKLAERWVASGWLAEPGDYFWLTMEEIERALMAEAEAGPTMPALARARREVYQTYAATEMPYAIRESDVTRLVPGQGLMGTALSSVLSGLPVSPGQVQGRVIVLRQPEDSARMQEGAILVTPSTDTAWFPVFVKARGLIVETGGLLSHGSIITREFGLPAVANIPDATSRFHDGDLVLIDGSAGLVQILDAAPSQLS
jgi:phosphohistidine swiveling domain-containing protein